MSMLDMRWTPDLAQQLPVRAHLAGMADERRKQPIFVGREMDFRAIA